MGMFSDRPVEKLWWSDDKATLHEVAMMSWGADHVYSSREKITLIDPMVVSARQQVVDALAVRGLAPATVTEIPFDIDASAVTDLNGLFRNMPSLLVAPRVKGSAAATDMSYMFSGCSSLVSVPDMNTSSVTNMRAMFNGCSSLVTVPEMDTGQVTNMRSMFNSCSSLVTVPATDTGRVEEMSFIFNGCFALESVPDMDTGRATTMRSMFNGCISLVAAPAMNTSAVTDMSHMFRLCRLLTSVPEFDVSSLTDAYNMFVDCDLIERAPLRDLATSLDLSPTSFTPSGADELMGLVRSVSGHKLEFPESALGCDPRIAEDKGWQVDVQGSGPTVDVFDVSLSGVLGDGVFHSLITLSPPPGEVWHVEIEGTVSANLSWSGQYPRLRVGGSWSGGKAPGHVSHSGTITSTNRQVGIETNADLGMTAVSFTGTVTVTYP